MPYQKPNKKTNSFFNPKKILILSLFLVFSFGWLAFEQKQIKVYTNSSNINQRLQQTRSKLQDVSQKRSSLEEEIKRMEEEIKQVEDTIKESDQEIEKLEKQIQENKNNIEELNQEIKKTLREMQVSGNTNPIEQLLSSQNLSQLLSQVYLFSSRHEKLQDTTNKLDAANKEMSENIKKQKETKKEAEETKNALELSKEEKDYLLTHFKGEEEEYKNQVNKLQSQQIQVSTQRSTSSAFRPIPGNVSASGLIWPAEGVITRCVVGGHIGCDVANRAAPNLMAAQAGTVSAVYRYTVVGYGLAVVIDHGGGLQTLYAHMNRIDVSAGQSVSRGQVIGQMGCTGMCTGTHLHFEVRQNGVRQDPLRYLPPR
jgi:murein DD-endopeptidase MepM/ murein hydrolase activator NlpD